MLSNDDLAWPAGAVTPSSSQTPSARGRPQDEGAGGERSPSAEERPVDDPAGAGPEGGGSEISLTPDPLAEAEAQLEGIDVDQPLVGIVMGSKSDMDTMEGAAKVLRDAGIRHELRVMSAHREPDTVTEYCRNARMRGLRVIIAGAGISAALPGAVAAHTELPVVGVPLSGRLSAAGGLDAILSIVQMPPDVPVACVGLDNPRNAAILAAQILGA